MRRSREYRFEQKERVIRNRKNLCKREKYAPEKCVSEPNRMAKQHPLDCGRANCQMCRYHKKDFDKKIKLKIPLEDNDDGE